MVYRFCICQECGGDPWPQEKKKGEYRKLCLISRMLSQFFSPKSRFPWPKLILLVMQTCLKFTSVPNPCCKNRGLPRWEWKPWRLRAALESCPCCAGSWLPATSQGLSGAHLWGRCWATQGMFHPLLLVLLQRERSSCDQGTRPGVRRCG